jgi:hypothetical protein
VPPRLPSESGEHSYTLAVSGASFTLAGSATRALDDQVDQSGVQTYTETVAGSLSLNHSGSNTFSLDESGSYQAGYSLSSVLYAETGSSSFTSTEQGTINRTGLVTATGEEIFGDANQSMHSGRDSNYSFSSQSSYTLEQHGLDSFVLSAAGTGNDGSFNLGSLSYDSSGSGGYSLTQSSTETLTGMYSAHDSLALGGSFGSNGSYTSGSLDLLGSSYTQTQTSTRQEWADGSFTRTAAGSLDSAGYHLAAFERTETAEGTYSLDQTRVTSEHVAETLTQGDTRHDPGATPESASLDHLGTTTYLGTTVLTGDSLLTETQSDLGTVSYSRGLSGSASNGSYSLSSYVYQGESSSGHTFPYYHQTESAGWSIETLTVDETTVGQGVPFQGDSAGAILGFDPGTEDFLLNGSWTQITSSNQSVTAGGYAQQSSYQAGSFGTAAWNLSSVSYEQAGSASYGDQGVDTIRTLNGVQTLVAVESGPVTGPVAFDAGEFAPATSSADMPEGSALETSVALFSETDTDNQAATGWDSYSLARRGIFGGNAYAFLDVVSDSDSLRTGSDILSVDSTSSRSGTRSFAVTAGDAEFDEYGSLVSGTYRDLSGVETFSEGSSSNSQRLGATVSNSQRTLEGSFANGSYSFSSLTMYDHVYSDWSDSSTHTDTVAGSFTWTEQVLQRHAAA